MHASPDPHLASDWWSNSDGCQVMWGRARAKWATCCPVPDETSRACRGTRGSTQPRSTARMGSLFRSAAGAFSIFRYPRISRRALQSHSSSGDNSALLEVEECVFLQRNKRRQVGQTITSVDVSCSGESCQQHPRLVIGGTAQGTQSIIY